MAVTLILASYCTDMEYSELARSQAAFTFS